MNDDLQGISFSNSRILDREKLRSRHLYHFCKRITDMVLSACGLVILSPVLLAVAGAIMRKRAAQLFIGSSVWVRMVNHSQYTSSAQCAWMPIRSLKS